MTRHATCQKFVVSRVRVPYMSSHREIDSVRLKLFGCGRTADSARVLLTGVFGDGLLLLHWAPRKQFPHAPRECLDVLDIEFLTTFGRTFPSQPSGLGVGQALLFGPCQRLFLDQHTLSLVAFSGATKTDHDGPERRVAAGSSGESGIPTLKKNEVIEIGAR